MVNQGLEGIVVAETATSRVDGEAGELIVRGVPVAELASGGLLEEALALLWDGSRDPATVQARQASLGRARERVWPVVREAGEAARATDGTAALRGALGLLEDEDPEGLVAATGLAFAHWARRREGRLPLAPRADLAHAEDVYRCATGALDPARAQALGQYLCTVVDHGMNASTFAARVVASTGSDAVSAVVAALGALKGPLHGGAPGPVLDMLDAIGQAERAEGWIAAELAAGRRIMGMGHRVYRVRDPRAAVLEAAAARLADRGIGGERLALARAVEAAAQAALQRSKPDRILRANVEFYTAVLLEAAGFDRACFTPLFACGRVVGWLAHVDEQRRTGRLMRPRAAYVGPMTQ